MQKEEGNSTNKSSIVIIEDNEELAHFLEDLLSEQGYFVTVFTGAQFVQRFDYLEKKPDLFLIDAWLDNHTSGITQVKSLLKEKKNKKKPAIIVMSSDQSIEYEVDNLPINQFIHKPFQIGELLTTIQDAIETN